jgi:hypothetical protein
MTLSEAPLSVSTEGSGHVPKDPSHLTHNRNAITTHCLQARRPHTNTFQRITTAQKCISAFNSGSGTEFMCACAFFVLSLCPGLHSKDILYNLTLKERKCFREKGMVAGQVTHSMSSLK